MRRPSAGGIVAAMSKVTEASCDRETVELARRLYKSYTANSDNLNFQGQPCPEWSHLTPKIRSHWCAVAVDAAKFVDERSVSEPQTETRPVKMNAMEAPAPTFKSTPVPVPVDRTTEQDSIVTAVVPLSEQSAELPAIPGTGSGNLFKP